MNVSREADAAFIIELKRTNPERYQNLLRNMEREAGRLRLAQRVQPQRRCEHCGLPLPDDLRSDAKYCDSTCKRNAAFAKRGERQLPMAA